MLQGHLPMFHYCQNIYHCQNIGFKFATNWITFLADEDRRICLAVTCCTILLKESVISCLTEFTMTGGSSNYGNYSNRIFCSMIPEGGLLWAGSLTATPIRPQPHTHTHTHMRCLGQRIIKSKSKSVVVGCFMHHYSPWNTAPQV